MNINGMLPENTFKDKVILDGNLGNFYLEKEGIPHNLIYALMWINIAASQGHERAAEQRGEIARIMPPAEILEAQRLSYVCEAKYYKDC